MKSLFTCPICGQPLCAEEDRYVCSGGHSFDRAREGYVNLLPANRQHSKAPLFGGRVVRSASRRSV